MKETAPKSSSLSFSHEEEQEAGGGELVKRRELYAYLLKSFERQEPLGQNRLFFLERRMKLHVGLGSSLIFLL